MEFVIVDTLPAYQRLLDAPDDATRKELFQQELIEPFRGLVDIFGGDGLATFAAWNMSPEQFSDMHRQQMQTVVHNLREADAQNRIAQALEQGRAAFEQHIQPIPLPKITFGLCIADMSSTPWNQGYTGFGGVPGWIMIVYGEATEYNLQRIEAVTVHELHHNVMGAVAQAQNPTATDWNTSVMNTTVGEYIVGEGLAESFSTELYGEAMVGPWVAEFDETQLPQAKAIFKDALALTGFENIQRYLYHGTDFGLHPSAGYAIGYYVVQAYLKRTHKTVIEASLVSPRTILSESGFFDE